MNNISKWISVEERAPKAMQNSPCSKDVLAIGANGYFIATYYPHDGQWWTAHYGENDEICGGVTHWQPLPPKPPKRKDVTNEH